MVMQITCVTFDAADPGTVAQFWAAALGWKATVAGDGSGALCARPGVDALYLEFVRVPEAKRVKNRVHLGTAVDGPPGALDAEVARLEALGAALLYEEDLGMPGERNVVLRDPEGNEFCLGAHETP
jgi:catechol 2,3-dioxygenase-like lactoylglutathione lyase family enzyme